MKLVSLAVANFRGIAGDIDSNRIELSGNNSVFIFGKNNVGKTSFLKSYLSFYKDLADERDFSFSSEKDIEIELELKIDDTDAEAIDEGTNKKYRNLEEKYLNKEKILRLRKIWRHKVTGKATENLTFNYLADDWEEINYGGIGVHSTFQQFLLKPLLIEAMPSEAQVESVFNEVIKEVAKSALSDTESQEYKDAEATIRKLQAKAYDQDSIDAYENEVNKRFTKLFNSHEIEISEGSPRHKYTHDKLGKDFSVSFRHLRQAHETKYEHMGHGAVRMAIFLLMLMRDKISSGSSSKNFIVLFEEPELFLHPTLTKRLRELIYDVSESGMPFQVLCASHSPQMIDISQEKSSIVRMVNLRGLTRMYQVSDHTLVNSEQKSAEKVRRKIQEILRFNPFLCESFYADEVVLVEGDTEEVLWRGYLQSYSNLDSEVFLVNCKSCTNIPFYQKIFSEFEIPYSVICDSDHRKESESVSTNKTDWNGSCDQPVFSKRIQGTISEQFYEDKAKGLSRYFMAHDINFEYMHQNINDPYKYVKSDASKTISANNYLNKIVAVGAHQNPDSIPFISYVEKIIKRPLYASLAGVLNNGHYRV